MDFERLPSFYTQIYFRSKPVCSRILLGSVPISFALPEIIASGRSVVSLKTKTGLLSGASSCKPPESVNTK